MSSLIIAHDSHILMLDFVVDKLCVPSKSPFDAVVMSKFIVSFRFVDEDWVDVTPNRLDYRIYKGGSSLPQQLFHGGKSVVLSLPSETFACESKGMAIDVQARREISPHFETDQHRIELGGGIVIIDELFNEIRTELNWRRELGEHYKLIHRRDPITRTLKCAYALLDEDCEPTDCQLDLYLRLSHLGDSVITEIDRPSYKPQSHFYAQEETNLTNAYECQELADLEAIPTGNPAPFSQIRDKCELECVCTDSQRRLLELDDLMKDQGTGMDKDKDKHKPKKPKPRGKDEGTSMVTEVEDKSVGTATIKAPSVVSTRKPQMSMADLMKLLKKQRRGGGISVGYIDKERPCEPVCEPCVPCIPICIVGPCEPDPCCTSPMSCVTQTTVCCYE